MRRFAVLVIALGALIVAPMLPASAGDAPSTSALEWEPCGDAECATLAVPLDDAVDDGPTIDLALIRYPARDPDQRIGSLLMNPGGPGASGVEFVSAVGASMPDELRDRFNIVGFDPRGTAGSAGVDCLDDLDPYFDAEWAPGNRAERAELLAQAEHLADECEAAEGSELPYLQTERTARDMDRIRIALGDDKLTYLGYSYGTLLGAWYAEQFPEHVRALVLDGPIDPAIDGPTMQVQQALGFEHSLIAFLADCAKDIKCRFHGDGDPAGAYDALRARIATEPMKVEDGGELRELNTTRFDLAVTQLLYEGRSAWSELASSLERADRGDGSDLLFYADSFSGRIEDGQYDDAEESFLAIGCVDGPPVGGVDGMREIERVAARKAPRLGPAIVNGSLPCAFWPVEAAEPRVLRGEGAPPILVLGARHDPATPLSWAKGLASGLDSGVLVKVDSSRHTSFDGGNVCVDALVIAYMVDLEVPEKGTEC